jgi:predicted RNA-binding Zn-ribbon protein involved in translation (DUF1610 family)
VVVIKDFKNMRNVMLNLKKGELKEIANKILSLKGKSVDFCPNCGQSTIYYCNPMYMHICESCGKQCTESELIHKSDVDFMVDILREEFQNLHLKTELEKCKESPHYFAMNYLKVQSNGESYGFQTNLNEEEFNEKFGVFKWSDDKVIDFTNWFLDLHKLPTYKLENQTILESFKNGDDFKLWHKNSIKKKK